MAKLSAAQITNEVESKDFTILDISKYENTKSPIMIKCSEGHILETNLFSFRKATFRCPKCDGDEITISRFPPAKNGYRILAFDNATEFMGISIFDNGKLVYFDLHVFKGNFESRLTNIFKIVTEVMIKNWDIDYIVFEDIQYQNNYQTYKKLAMLLGVLTVAAKKAEIDFRVVPPVEWRSYYQITGRREEMKLKAVNLVKTMYNINVRDDVAEAILIGHYIASQKYIDNIDNAF